MKEGSRGKGGRKQGLRVCKERSAHTQPRHARARTNCGGSAVDTIPPCAVWYTYDRHGTSQRSLDTLVAVMAPPGLHA